MVPGDDLHYVRVASVAHFRLAFGAHEEAASNQSNK